MKATVFITLLAAALSVPLAGQTLTEQLQKGIYTEEVLGNRDEAIRIYRQIIAAPAVPRALAQDAKRRLARLTAAKRLRDYDDLAVKITDLVVKITGQYRHRAFGITFDVPPGWFASETYPSSDGGEQVTLTEESTRRMINVWMARRSTLAHRLAEAAAASPAEKVQQRHSGYGIPGMLDPSTYDIPRDTIQPAFINGRHATIAVGSYRGTPPERAMQHPELSPPPEPMREYMTWIVTTQSRVFFYARVPVDDVAQLRPPFEQLVYSAVIP